MALDKDRLGLAIWTAVKAQTSFGAELTAPLDAKGLALWTAVAEEIVTEIEDHAEVITDTPDAQPGSVHLPGTGTII